MSLRPEAMRRSGDAARHRLSRTADALAVAAARPAWLDGWAAVWGIVLARPDLSIGGTWSRVAGVGVIVWLLVWGRDLEDSARDSATATTIPGGRGALAAAALAVAAGLGTGPLVASAAWLAVGFRRFRPGARWDAAAGQLRLWIGALGAWLSLHGLDAARGARLVEPGAPAPIAWLQFVQANGIDVALILAGCALTVGGARFGGAGSSAARPRSGVGQAAAFVLLGIGMIMADRPGGLWLVALCAAALWPKRLHSTLAYAAAPTRAWLPLALGAACIVDRLVP